MAQHDYDLANQSRTAFRADLNNALLAIATQNSGATAPATTFANQIWWDNTANLLKQRNGSNTAWVTIASWDGTTLIPYRAGSPLGTAATKDTGTSGNTVPLLDGANTWSASQTLSGVSLIEAEGADVASAATTNIWATDGNTRHITGTTTITSFGTAPQAGAWQKVIFDGVLTLTHSANLNLPGAANITTAAGDFAFVYADTTTQFDVLYFRANGTAVVGSTTFASTDETRTGTETAKAVTPAGLKGALGYSKLFTSAEIACTFGVNSAVSVAHGLGAVPVAFNAFLICKIAEHGYSVGDIIACTTGAIANGTPPLVTWADATNIGLSYQASVGLVNKGTGAGTGVPTDANWRWFFRAWI